MTEQLETFAPNPALKPWIDHLAIGRDTHLEHQLIAKSHQPHIAKSTPGDAKRFASMSAFNKRAAKRRTHWLVGPGGDLAGVAWYGPKPLPVKLNLPQPPTETFAIRLYEGYLGKGLAVPFIEQSLSLETALRRSRGERMPSLWLETSTDNPAALATYAKIGCEQVHNSAGHVILVLPAATIAQITGRRPEIHGIMKSGDHS